MPSKISVGEILDRARAGTESAMVSRVFGAPIERDGVTVVPVATVTGGGGGGGGSGTAATGEDSETPQGEGSGGGFGFSARPAGVYVIRNGDALWRPAVDVNRLAIGGQLVAIVALLVARSIVRRRRR